MIDPSWLLQNTIDLFLQSGGGKATGIAEFVAAIGAVLLGIVLFFTGLLGKISEKVGGRLEKSNHAVTRSIGKWLVDKDPEIPIKTVSQSEKTGQPSKEADHVTVTHFQPDVRDLSEIYSRDFLLNATRQSPDGHEERLASVNKAILVARKYIKDQQETSEYLEALESFPWLEDYVDTQMELQVSHEELIASQNDERNS